MEPPTKQEVFAPGNTVTSQDNQRLVACAGEVLGCYLRVTGGLMYAYAAPSIAHAERFLRGEWPAGVPDWAVKLGVEAQRAVEAKQRAECLAKQKPRAKPKQKAKPQPPPKPWPHIKVGDYQFERRDAPPQGPSPDATIPAVGLRPVVPIPPDPEPEDEPPSVHLPVELKVLPNAEWADTLLSLGYPDLASEVVAEDLTRALDDLARQIPR